MDIKREASALPRAFIFDCDGTLIDSMGMWLEIYPRLVARYGLTMTPEDFAATEHLAMPEEIAYYHRALGIGASAEALLEEVRAMLRDEYAHRLPLRPGVRAFLDEAQMAGIPMVIATSTEEDLVRSALAHHGIDDCFEGLVTTAEAGRSKEFPDVYELALERVAPGARPEEAWIFEDAMFGLAAARGAGFNTLGIYDPHGRADRSVVEEQSSIFVESFEALRLTDLLAFEGRA